MLTTVFYVLIFLAVLVISFVLGIISLRWGLRWAKAPDVRIARVALAVAILILVQTVVGGVLLLCLSTKHLWVAVLVLIATIVNIVLVPCLVISKVFKLRFTRSFRVFLPLLLISVLMSLLSHMVIRPYVMETYRVGGNSMAPTLLGPHHQGTCQECGRPSFCSALPGMYTRRRVSAMICQDNFHVTRSDNYSDRIFEADRIMAAKFLRPQRWDIIVFRDPSNPSVIYVQRLVGLPGEEIEIRDGSVWADGGKLIPPDSIRQIQYVSEFVEMSVEMWGTHGRPAKLAADEYFVLGDFSANATDSRVWTRGAPGHNPYAVPESHILGVATHTIWPASRWRMLR